jgi:hypothetical protein
MLPNHRLKRERQTEMQSLMNWWHGNNQIDSNANNNNNTNSDTNTNISFDWWYQSNQKHDNSYSIDQEYDSPEDITLTYFKMIPKDIRIYLIQFCHPNDIHNFSLIPEYFSPLNDTNGYVYLYYWNNHVGGDIVKYATRLSISDYQECIIHVYSTIEYTYQYNIEYQIEYCIKYQLIIFFERLLIQLNALYPDKNDEWRMIYGRCYYYYQRIPINEYSDSIINLLICYGLNGSELLDAAREYELSISIRPSTGAPMGCTGRTGLSAMPPQKGHRGYRGPPGGRGPRGYRGKSG